MEFINMMIPPFDPVIHGYDFRKLSTIAGALCALLLVYQFFLCTYRFYFHPLARFPGPWLAAVSDIWIGWILITGRQIFIFKELHEKYGSIIRVGPNDLSFATVNSYKDIHMKLPGRKTFPKTEFYDVLNTGFMENGIISERDIEKHARKKKLVAPGFSPAAVRLYEPASCDTSSASARSSRQRQTHHRAST